MKNSIPYLHVLDGRIRIKIPEVKRDSLKAYEIEQILRNMNGITHVKANPMTGNVLILFESSIINPEQILKALNHLSRFENQPDSTPQTESTFGSKIAEAFLSKAAELAVEQLIFALV